MTRPATSAVILAAGHGTRMRSALPKVLHPLGGMPMIDHVCTATEAAGIAPEDTVCVLGPSMSAVESHIAPRKAAYQESPLGTGHAVLAARDAVSRDMDGIVVLYGDVPLITAETLVRMLDALYAPPCTDDDGQNDHKHNHTGIVVCGFCPPDGENTYGRLIKNSAGFLERIVEAKDATPDERAIPLCNSGIMALRAPHVWDWLTRIDTRNAQGEYYLTDVVSIAGDAGYGTRVVMADATEVAGVNTRTELALREATLQQRLRTNLMDQGVSMIAPDTVFVAADTRMGQDVTIDPHVIIGPDVCIESGVHIKGFSALEGCHIGANAIIGPHARIRPDTHIGAGARVGNFVELKNTRLGSGAKANHLAYLGDADIGVNSNIGAGTITCNYDGINKHQTHIGTGAFIGSNTALVAPVHIGDGAIIGAGSTVREDVPALALALTSGHYSVRTDGASTYRMRRQQVKKAPR